LSCGLGLHGDDNNGFPKYIYLHALISRTCEYHTSW
jgi:hypothetical protein